MIKKRLTVLWLAVFTGVAGCWGESEKVSASSDKAIFESLPIPDEWLYVQQLTDDQGCWDARLISTERIITMDQTVRKIRDPKYKKLAQERLDQYLHFDGPMGEHDLCPNAADTADLIRKKNEILNRRGLKVHHSPFRVQLYYTAGRGTYSYGGPSSKGKFQSDNAGGSVMAEPPPERGESDNLVYHPEAVVKLEAFPATGYKFEKWEVRNSKVYGCNEPPSSDPSPVISLIMHCEREAIAHFSPAKK